VLEIIRENIKISDEENQSYYKLKKHKMWIERNKPDCTDHSII
jgi:hypothetical protein